MWALWPAWPPMASRSTTTVSRPSEAAYMAAARPAGPAPITARSHVSPAGLLVTPRASATSRFVGSLSTFPPRTMTTGRRVEGSRPYR